MRATTAISALALAGSALAAPHYGRPQHKEVQNLHVVYETVVHTVYFTEGQQESKPTPTPEAVQDAPAVTTTVVYEEPKSTPTPTSTEVYQEAPAPASTTTKEAATSAAATSAAAAPSSGTYQDVVDEWRAKLGKKPLANDAKLEANALDTVVSSNGQMVHKLNPGSMGQVLAPGEAGIEGFTKVFVGGWLCEIPTLPGLDGICDTMSQGWAYEGQTGHADILKSDDYTKIGCALHAGIWCCDVA